MTLWQNTYASGRAPQGTAATGERVIVATDGGVTERALTTAENTASALCRLVEMLEDKGVLRTVEVRHVLDLYGYEPLEGTV
jgi:hypothetical protein